MVSGILEFPEQSIDLFRSCVGLIRSDQKFIYCVPIILNPFGHKVA